MSPAGETSAEVGSVDLEVAANGGAQHTGKYVDIDSSSPLVTFYNVHNLIDCVSCLVYCCTTVPG